MLEELFKCLQIVDCLEDDNPAWWSGSMSSWSSREEKYLQNYCCQLMSTYRVSFTTNFLILKPSMTRQSRENYVTMGRSEWTNISLLTTLISDRSDTIKPLSRLEMHMVKYQTYIDSAGTGGISRQ